MRAPAGIQAVVELKASKVLAAIGQQVQEFILQEGIHLVRKRYWSTLRIIGADDVPWEVRADANELRLRHVRVFGEHAQRRCGLGLLGLIALLTNTLAAGGEHGQR